MAAEGGGRDAHREEDGVMRSYHRDGRLALSGRALKRVTKSDAHENDACSEGYISNLYFKPINDSSMDRLGGAESEEPTIKKGRKPAIEEALGSKVLALIKNDETGKFPTSLLFIHLSTRTSLNDGFCFTGSTTDNSLTNLKLGPSAQLKGTVDTIPTNVNPMHEKMMPAARDI